MLYKFFEAQWKYPVKNDWVHQVQQDLVDFNLEENIENLRSLSKYTFKRQIKNSMKEHALKNLILLKNKHKKLENLKYPELKIQKYLKSNKISVESAITLVRWRTRMARFKENYKGTYLNSACPHCLVQPDTKNMH